MELHVTYVFRSTDAEMHAKLEMLVKEAMEQYNNKIKEKEREKIIKKKNKWLFTMFFSDVHCFYFPLIINAHSGSVIFIIYFPPLF